MENAVWDAGEERVVVVLVHEVGWRDRVCGIRYECQTNLTFHQNIWCASKTPSSKAIRGWKKYNGQEEWKRKRMAIDFAHRDIEPGWWWWSLSQWPQNLEKKMAGGVENAVAGRRLSDDGVVRSPGPKLK